MLKMKVDPAMCMKTNITMTKCHAIDRPFAQKSASCTLIGNNRSNSLAENAFFRGNLGKYAPNDTSAAAAVVVHFAVAAVSDRRCLLNQEPAVRDRRYQESNCTTTFAALFLTWS
jgi:hypothetical protein